MRRLLLWLLPFVARLYGHYRIPLDQERMRADLTESIRQQLASRPMRALSPVILAAQSGPLGGHSSFRSGRVQGAYGGNQ